MIHEQTKMSTQNDNICTYLHMSILSLFIRSKCYSSIRLKHKIDYNTITVLLSCYLYSIYVKDTFTTYNILMFSGYFNGRRMKKFFIKLTEHSLITLAGDHKQYMLTDPGLAAIKEIQSNYDTVLYQFCNKYNIVL